MALHLRSNKDVKKSSYYVWYLGAREAKGVDSMPSAIAHLLERERLQEPFKVTLQVSSKGLKIIQTVHPGGSSRSAVKHLVPSNAVLAVIQREDVVAASLRLPNSATSNIVHVHAYRCDSVETAELLGGQLKIFAAAHAENIARLSSVEGRIRGNLGSDGRSTRESESSEGSGELRHDPVQTTIYESLAAELRAKLGRGNSGDDVGPILLPPRDYDTVHRQRGNLAGIEFRRCLNQTIVGGSSAVDRGGTRSAASSGIGSDSAATPPPYQPHHSLGSRPSRPSRDSSSDDDWAAATEDNFLPETETGTNLTLPRVPRSPERLPSQVPIRGVSPSTRNRRAAELRQRSPSPQYQPRNSPSDVTTPRERFQDAKEKFRAMEKREAIIKPFISRQREVENNRVVHRVQSNKLEPSRQMYEERSNRQHPISVNSTASHDNLIIRRTHQELLERENDMLYRGKPRPRTHHYAIERPSEPELSRARPRSFYENPSIVRDFRDQKNNLVDPREIRDYRDRGHPRDIREKIRPRVTTYHEMTEHERYPGLDRDSARSPLEIVPSAGRYRHSYAEPPRLGLAALHPY